MLFSNTVCGQINGDACTPIPLFNTTKVDSGFSCINKWLHRHKRVLKNLINSSPCCKKLYFYNSDWLD